jgi:phosphatidylcholine synthase
MTGRRMARPLAWSIHLLTASGAVLALLALYAVDGGRSREALLWLLAALLIDGVDGMLARSARVRERVPRIDGDALDLVVDYLTYVLVPVWFILKGAYLPASLALPLGAMILVSSVYVFARRDMKTDDGYFRGFPALWNVVALYFFLLKPVPPLAAAVVIAFIVTTFAPVHVIHPFRARDYRPLAPALAIVWTSTTAALLLPNVSDAVRTALVVISLTSAALLIGLGLLRSLRGARHTNQVDSARTAVRDTLPSAAHTKGEG